MFKLGALLALIGVASCVLTLIGYELRYLMWIEKWGTNTGWMIRGGIVLLGLILMAMGGKSKKK